MSGTKRKPTRPARSNISAALVGDNEAVILQDRLLLSDIPLNTNFFYFIQQYDGDNVIASERGVGELQEVDGSLRLIRERAISYYDGTYSATSRPGVFYFFNPAYPHLTVQSYIPERYIDTLHSPHSVLCSIEGCVPSPVELEDNTLLGRMDDRIQSIDGDELRQIITDNNIIAAVTDTRVPLNVRTPQINLLRKDSVLSAPSLQVRPVYTDAVKPPNPQRGTIIFNDEANCFEGFDGKEWRRLVWEDR